MAALDPFKSEDLRKAVAARHSERLLRRRERHLDDIREAVKTPKGRRLYWSHLEVTGYFALSFVAGAPDVTAKHEGMRESGMAIFKDLMEAAPEAFFQMYRENASELAQDKIEDDRLVKEAEDNA